MEVTRLRCTCKLRGNIYKLIYADISKKIFILTDNFNDHKKVNRLVELHCEYLSRLVETDKVLREEVMYIKKLEGGLFHLQQLDYMMRLKLRGEKLSMVKEVVRSS